MAKFLRFRCAAPTAAVSVLVGRSGIAMSGGTTWGWPGRARYRHQQVTPLRETIQVGLTAGHARISARPGPPGSR